MVTILTQDRKSILNVETVDRIYVDGGTIYAQGLGGTVTEVGRYEKPANIVKVMNYIAFSLASAAKDGGKTVIIPSEEVVSNDKDIVAQILKAVREKKADAGITLVEIAPELKDYLDGLKGGDGK
jgi:hypothetical protein